MKKRGMRTERWRAGEEGGGEERGRGEEVKVGNRTRGERNKRKEEEEEKKKRKEVKEEEER